jgi:hypothetical protein
VIINIKRQSYIKYAIIPLRKCDGTNSFFPPPRELFMLKTKFGTVPVHVTSQRPNGLASYIHSYPYSGNLTIRILYNLLEIKKDDSLRFKKVSSTVYEVEKV